MYASVISSKNTHEYEHNKTLIKNLIGYFTRTFKDILMNGSADATEINYHGEGKNDVYIMSQQTIKDTFMLDEKKYQVQMKQSHANLELKGASTEVAVHYKIIDIKTDKVVAEDTTPSQPINGKTDSYISFSPTHPIN